MSPRSILALLLGAALFETSISQSASGRVIAWGNSGQLPPLAVPAAALSNVVAVAVGEFHNLALKTDGTVIDWAADHRRQIGAPGNGTIAIAAGRYHSVALTSDGVVTSWGGDISLLVPAGARSGITAIAAGSYFSMALNRDGKVLVWGQADSPLNIPAAARFDVTAIAATDYIGLVLKRDGYVVAWDFHQEFTLPEGFRSDVVAIAGGRNHLVALKRNGSVHVWGDFQNSVVPPEALSGVVAIAAGSFTMALKSDGTLISWGGGPPVPAAAKNGVLAFATRNGSALAVVDQSPLRISKLPQNQTVHRGQSAQFSVTASGPSLNFQWQKNGTPLSGYTTATCELRNVSAADIGEYSVVVSNPTGSLTSSPPAVLTVKPEPVGTVVAWGCEAYIPTKRTIVPSAAQSDVIAIAAHYYFSLALKRDGSVVAWGANQFGEGGITRERFLDVPVEAKSGVTAIAVANSYSLALKFDGSVVSWPEWGIVPLEYRTGITAIAAGSSHVVALKADGGVATWGAGVAAGPVPETVKSGIVKIAAGPEHSLALTSEGRVIAWGGQTTVPASAQSGVIAIAAGTSSSMALKLEGSVVVWGAADGPPIAAQSDVVGIDAREDTFVALKRDGSVVVWGKDHCDKSGRFLEQIPDAVRNGVTAISAGDGYILAVLGAPVSLWAQSDGDSLALMWPRSTSGLTLQTTSNLMAPVTWTDVLETPSISGVQNVVRIRSPESARWYRLR